MTDHDLAALTRIARDAAEAAGTIQLRHFRRPDLPIETKPDNTPVTIADRESEEKIREVLRAGAPGFAIKGEEFGEEPGADGQTRDRWLIDPIDGTKNFMRGRPVFASLLALEIDGEIVVGVVHAPAMGRNNGPVGDTWWAYRGGGAWCNEDRIHVSAVKNIPDASIGYGGVSHFARPAGRWQALQQLFVDSYDQRGWGDWWGHVLVADGRLDAMVDPIVADYDVGPMPVLLGEAGGRFTSITGEARIDGGCGLSTNGKLHDEFVRRLAPHW